MEWIFEKYLKTLLLLWIRYGVRIVDYVWNPFFFLPRTFMEIKWPPNIFLGETCLEWFTFFQIHDIFRKRKLHQFGYIYFMQDMVHHAWLFENPLWFQLATTFFFPFWGWVFVTFSTWKIFFWYMYKGFWSMKGPNSKSLANFEEEKTTFLLDIYNRLE